MVLSGSHSDEVLMSRLKSGDEGAFTEVYERYWKRVYAVGYYFSRRKEEAEDIVQQVFMSLWERRESLSIQGSVEGYLATAAKYSVLDARMKVERREGLLKKMPLRQGEATAEQELQARVLAEYLHHAVEKLPERTRIIFKYSRQAELSISEIAERMDVSPKTVESHITKAIKTLRVSLRELNLWLFSVLLFILSTF
jgi:RNA polymerase sigma-70 factor (family 1)